MKQKIGKEARELFEGVVDRKIRFFGIPEASQICRKTYHATAFLLEDLARRGWVMKVCQGLYAVVPEEGGTIHKLAVGRELMEGAEYYISHGSAMEVHGMLTGTADPVIITLRGTPEERGGRRQMRSRTALGVSYRFVSEQVISERRMGQKLQPRPEPWMRMEVEVAPGEIVQVSDPEWTIVGGLSRPELCGGAEAVIRGLGLARERIDLEKLVEYAMVVRNRTAVRRLGYALEVLGMQTEETKLMLGFAVLTSYGRLEPGKPWVGDWDREWKLDVNGEG